MAVEFAEMNIIERTGKNMPPIPEFVNALDIMREIHKSKNMDYADSNNAFSNFDVQEYFANLFNSPRDKIFVTMLAVKFARLATLMNKSTEPNHESIEDTFIDAANYTLLWRADYIRRKNGRPVRTNGEAMVGAKHG